MKKLFIIAILLLAGTADAALLTGQTPASYSLPSGWSLVRAQDFEGSCPASQSCGGANGAITTTKPHTGPKSVEGTYSNEVEP
jgi:hypothetical protein